MSVIALGLLTNAAADALLAFTIFFHIAVYMAWLKRSTPQSIVIEWRGGCVATRDRLRRRSEVGVEPLILF
jgi:heme O synthase-like polyprenyltransferase